MIDPIDITHTAPPSTMDMAYYDRPACEQEHSMTSTWLIDLFPSLLDESPWDHEARVRAEVTRLRRVEADYRLYRASAENAIAELRACLELRRTPDGVTQPLEPPDPGWALGDRVGIQRAGHLTAAGTQTPGPDPLEYVSDRQPFRPEAFEPTAGYFDGEGNLRSSDD